MDKEKRWDSYQDFLDDPQSVSTDWRQFFEGFEFARIEYKPRAIADSEYPSEFKVINLINAYLVIDGVNVTGRVGDNCNRLVL